MKSFKVSLFDKTAISNTLLFLNRCHCFLSCAILTTRLSYGATKPYLSLVLITVLASGPHIFPPLSLTIGAAMEVPFGALARRHFTHPAEAPVTVLLVRDGKVTCGLKRKVGASESMVSALALGTQIDPCLSLAIGAAMVCPRTAFAGRHVANPAIALVAESLVWR